MVVKKKKLNQKKPAQKVQKAVKKGGSPKAKVSTKKAAKKVAKTVKKAAPKLAQKVVKKTPEKKTQKAKVVQKSDSTKLKSKTLKPQAPKKAVKVVKVVKAVKAVKKAVQPVKSVKPAVKAKAPVKKNVVEKKQPEKKTVEKPAVVKAVKMDKTVTIQKPVQTPVNKQPTIEQSKKKMIQRNDDVTNEGAAIQTAPSARKKATTLLGALEFMPYEPKVGEAYMNDHQRDHFRKILNAWKQQLMQDVDLTVGHLKEEAVFYADPVDRASQEEGFNLELRTRDRERKLIKKIEQSLDLLNAGEYGYCEDCAAEIGIRRLEARPTAVKCIDCKTFQEIREKQLGG